MIKNWFLPLWHNMWVRSKPSDHIVLGIIVGYFFAVALEALRLL